MQPKLEGYAAAVVDALDASALQRTVSQLESLDSTVATHSDLHAALTDTAIAAPVRSAVMRDLLSGKVDEDVVRLASYAAKVSAGQEVPAAISDLVHYVVVRSRPEPYAHHILSLLASRKRVAGYADAVLEGVSTDDFGGIEDDLFRWSRTVEATPELRRVLVDRDAALDSRLELTRALLEGKVSATSLQLALYVIRGGRPRDVVGTLDYLVDYIAAARQWRVARVWSARELDDASRASLVASLRTITGHDVELQVSEDATLLGGVLVQVGDLRLDATTKGRLGALRDALIAHPPTELQLNSN